MFVFVGGGAGSAGISTKGLPSTAVAFSLPDVRAGQPSVALAAAPGRPVVLNFFASWCDPCRAEMPLLEEVARRDGARVLNLGVDVQDNRALALQLLRQTGVTYPAAYDPDRVVSDRYGIIGLPVTFFIAGDGHVVRAHPGQLSRSQLAQLLRQLLSSANSP